MKHRNGLEECNNIWTRWTNSANEWNELNREIDRLTREQSGELQDKTWIVGCTKYCIMHVDFTITVMQEPYNLIPYKHTRFLYNTLTHSCSCFRSCQWSLGNYSCGQCWRWWPRIGFGRSCRPSGMANLLRLTRLPNCSLTLTEEKNDPSRKPRWPLCWWWQR